VDLKNGPFEIELRPIGHGHYAGEDGDPDFSTLITALKIASMIVVKIK
jgi:hypothetical protein